MHVVSIEDHIDAGHQLIGYPGPCGNSHGHRWLVRVWLSGFIIYDSPLMIDFKVAREILKKKVINFFDHQNINEVFQKVRFEEISTELQEAGKKMPTAELLSEVFYRLLTDAYAEMSVNLDKVRVNESPDSYAEYYE